MLVSFRRLHNLFIVQLEVLKRIIPSLQCQKMIIIYVRLSEKYNLCFKLICRFFKQRNAENVNLATDP